MAAGEGSVLELTAGNARLQVLPAQGAALAGLWVRARPVLRPMTGEGPFAASSIVLAPFSNRVSRAFDWNGATITLPRNLASEAFPIHGDAFQRPWTVTTASPSDAVLDLPDGAIGPLLYTAQQVMTLSPDRLDLTLTLTSRADRALPFGLGFHPWFPRGRETQIQFSAGAVWLEDARHLPATKAPTRIPEGWNFAQARPLPGDWINSGFADWSGDLQVHQGPEAVSATLRACPRLRTLILYSPHAQADFFCAEPVSHPVDAFNLPRHPGLQVLQPGETLSGSMRLEWTA